MEEILEKSNKKWEKIHHLKMGSGSTHRSNIWSHTQFMTTPNTWTPFTRMRIIRGYGFGPWRRERMDVATVSVWVTWGICGKYETNTPRLHNSPIKGMPWCNILSRSLENSLITFLFWHNLVQDYLLYFICLTFILKYISINKTSCMKSSKNRLMSSC